MTAVATDVPRQGVNNAKAPSTTTCAGTSIAEDVGFGKTSAPTAPPPPVVEPGHCSAGNPRCRAPARLYPTGWRCDQHRPGPTTERRKP
jgi:hypothetical protein